MKGQNIVQEKSYRFALRIIKLFHYLRIEKKDTPISNQLIRSGTSIGANIEEATGASTRKDFKAKLDIAHKEARETRYWLRLLKDSDYINSAIGNSLIGDCEELIKLLTSILNTIKKTQ